MRASAKPGYNYFLSHCVIVWPYVLDHCLVRRSSWVANGLQHFLINFSVRAIYMMEPVLVAEKHRQIITEPPPPTDCWSWTLWYKCFSHFAPHINFTIRLNYVKLFSSEKITLHQSWTLLCWWVQANSNLHMQSFRDTYGFFLVIQPNSRNPCR